MAAGANPAVLLVDDETPSTSTRSEDHSWTLLLKLLTSVAYCVGTRRKTLAVTVPNCAPVAVYPACSGLISVMPVIAPAGTARPSTAAAAAPAVMSADAARQRMLL